MAVVAVCFIREVYAEMKMDEEVEIIRWSGIWRQGQEVRVGARLADGRDALLVAFLGGDAGQPSVHYSLIIQGIDHQAEFVIPTELEKRVEEKLFQNRRTPGSRTLKDLKLF